MSAGEILAVAVRAGVGPGTSVLDLCCGPGGPGRLITQELGCDYLGVDADASVVELARGRAEALLPHERHARPATTRDRKQP